MATRRSVLRIITDTINLLKKSGDITSITRSGSFYVIDTDSSDLSIDERIIVDGRIVTVKSILSPTQIRVFHDRGNINLTTTTWQSASPMFDHGTEELVSGVLQKQEDVRDFAPFIWLVEPFLRDTSLDRVSSIGEDIKLKFLVLDSFDQNWVKSSEYYVNKLDNLETIAQQIVEMLRDNVYTITPLFENRGYKKTSYQGKEIFGYNLCGVRIELDLPIDNNYFDECFDYVPPRRPE